MTIIGLLYSLVIQCLFGTGHLCVDAISTAVMTSRQSEPVSAAEGTPHTSRKPVDASGH